MNVNFKSYVVLSPVTASPNLTLLVTSLQLLFVGVRLPGVGVVVGVWLDKKSGGMSEDS